MPELPEVEILVHHLRPLLRGKTIRGVKVLRPRSVRPDSPEEFRKMVSGATFRGLSRRGKYLLFQLQPKKSTKPFQMLGHLGMTGRMFVALNKEKLPRHAAIVFDLDGWNLVFEDYRYFGRMSLDMSAVKLLGPEPLKKESLPEKLLAGLKKSRQPIKVKLLDQSLIAGIGNIYASEALFRARISPKLSAKDVTAAQAKHLWRRIVETLAEAIKSGSTVPLKTMSGKSDALFYFSSDGENFYSKRLRVYNRAGKPCLNCGTKIRRMTQAGRSTFFCPRCQKLGK